MHTCEHAHNDMAMRKIEHTNTSFSCKDDLFLCTVTCLQHGGWGLCYIFHSCHEAPALQICDRCCG